MTVPTPTQSLQSLDMHICPMIACQLKEVPTDQRPRIERLVLRLTSNAAVHAQCTAEGSRDVLNKTISHFQGIRTLCIHDDSRPNNQPADYRLLHLFSNIKPLQAKNLPEMEVLILKRSYQQPRHELQDLLAKAVSVSNRTLVMIA